MKERLQNIKDEALKAIESADMPEKLNDVRVKFLGKKGELTAVLKGMKDVAAEDRPKVGQMVNETRAAIETLLEESKQRMEAVVDYRGRCVGGHHGDRCILCGEERERRRQWTVNSTNVYFRHTKAGTAGYRYSDSRPALKQQEKREPGNHPASS